jgi:hypothetical protein
LNAGHLRHRLHLQANAMTRRHVVYGMAAAGVVLAVVVGLAAPKRRCELRWDRVTTLTDGTPVSASEVVYRVYVTPIAEEFLPGAFQVETSWRSVPCTAVGFAPGGQAAVTAVHTPTGRESDWSNVVVSQP